VTVAELTGARLVGYFEAGRAWLKTYNNRRGIVSTFLKFALQRDWITDNPLMKIPPRRIRRGVSPLSTRHSIATICSGCMVLLFFWASDSFHGCPVSYAAMNFTISGSSATSLATRHKIRKFTGRQNRNGSIDLITPDPSRQIPCAIKR